MKSIRGYKTELDLNDRQRTACVQHAGAARFVYNWGLRRKMDAYAAGAKSPSAIDLHRELNALKKGESSLPTAFFLLRGAVRSAAPSTANSL